MMNFVRYDESMHARFDLPTRRRMNELKAKYGEVEFKQMGPNEYCIRITSKIGNVSCPLAAIGETPYAAAERLMRLARRE